MTTTPRSDTRRGARPTARTRTIPWRRFHCAVMLAAVAVCLPTFPGRLAAETEAQAKGARVQQYILKEDYPELFQGKPYRMKLRMLDLADLDDDGVEEFLVATQPHYRQSAPILIYQLLPDGGVRRVLEGLAPGPLQPLDGEYLDTHTLGVALDMQVGTKETVPTDEDRFRVVVDSMLKHGFRVVAYRNFFHADHPDNGVGFLDMRQASGFADEDNCERFQFSEVKDLKAGRLAGDGKRTYLLAVAAGRLYVYRIRAISPEGFLDKTVTERALPPHFASLEVNDAGEVVAVDADGKAHAIPAPKEA